MGGGYKWNEAMHEFSNAAAPNCKDLINSGDLLIKTVPLARTNAGPWLMPTLDTVQARSYPLTREVYYYTCQRPGQVMNPLVKEYWRFVLSREGQAAVQQDGKYLPMTAAFATEQRAKLEAGGKAAKAEGG